MEQQDFQFVGNAKGFLHLEYLPMVNYAMMINGDKPLTICGIANTSDDEWRNVHITISGECFSTAEAFVDVVQPNSRISIANIGINPDMQRLLSLDEGFDTQFCVSVEIGGEQALNQPFPIRMMTYEQWPGVTIRPELLAAFVTPNVPEISRVSMNAARFLEKWTGDSALSGYQTRDPNKVRQQVAAIYEALRSEGLVYFNPPASFETLGQRIRMVDRALAEKQVTCLDSTILFASCLEACDIHPILVIVEGHAFVGAWLIDNCAPSFFNDDPAYLLKGCSPLVNEMVFIETTKITSSDPVAFEDAVNAAVNNLKTDKFVVSIDVFKCRLAQIKPLPRRIIENGSFIIQNEGIEHENATKEVRHFDPYELNIGDKEETIGKQQIWERKLLDISLRNNLINLRLGQRVVPFISFEIDKLEDRMQAGETYRILPSPMAKIEPDESGIYDSSLFESQLSQLVVNDLQNKRLYSYQTEAELERSLKYLYRASRTALEENGANSLFLALGLLKWYENANSEKPRYAPILLLPVDIIRKSAAEGYTIRTRDEDIIFNTTLAELLKQQFEVRLSGLSPLPTDESGVDVKKVFAILTNSIREQKKWTIIEESLLGLFSFNKFVMWNDIHSNAEYLRQNPIVNSLMNNRLQKIDDTLAADAREIDRNASPSDFAVPVDVDSSQLEAVVEAGQGKSFILYGPPGTGKSQTITNMIANALYQGKRVLFVAEKMAALSVVQNRLQRIGLDPFCLELHSNKVTKSHFLQQLKTASEVRHLKSPEAYQKEADVLLASRRSIMGYIDAVHAKQPSGMSLYDCIAGYLSKKTEPIKIDNQLLQTIDSERLASLTDKIQSLDAVFKILGHPNNHALRGIEPMDVSPQSLEAIEKTVGELNKLLTGLDGYKSAIERLTGISIPDNKQSFAAAKELSAALCATSYITRQLLTNSTNQGFVDEVNQLVACGRERDAMRQQILQNAAEQIFTLDGFRLNAEWQAASQKWFLARYFAQNSIYKQVKLYSPAITKDKVGDVLSALLKYQNAAKKIESESAMLADCFGSLARAGKEDWNSIGAAIHSAPVIYRSLVQIANSANIQPQMVLEQFVGNIGTDWQSFALQHENDKGVVTNFNNAYEPLMGALEGLCKVDLPVEQPFAQLPALFARYVGNMHQLKDWCQWCVRKAELQREGLQVVTDYIIGREAMPLEAADAFYKGVCEAAAHYIINTDNRLQLFNGLILEQTIQKYRDQTTRFQELTKRELFCRLASRVPNMTMEATSTSEVGILNRNIMNGGRGTSIRNIIDQIPTLLPKLCPCMLMSPISVAQFIDLAGEKFDIVIFDEASQMPTSEAVGAIARGKNLVVVGDPKQMPPTSFFTSTQVDEDEADIDDMESILDDCIALSMPARYLSWHYRSKHESLIAFSNQQYYEGRLYTFPSVDDRQSKVSFEYIKGCYDKGRSRSNKAEAEAVVDEIIRRLSDDELSKRSIGVVSFSQVQQNHIEDVLTDRLAQNKDLEQKAYGGEEPIFIKNLENVQGDERDVILFSVGYGPDADGKISMNFGPLNNAGGERRLNVAVSRARYEMKVFSSLNPEDIDLRRTKALGVEGLKRFLDFAKNGNSALFANGASGKAQDALAQQIAIEIQNMGYKVDTLVGRSDFRVDVAVIDPQNPDKYLLGILFDGPNYFNTKTSRDREIVQPSVLRMLGWNVMRVWSVDWFEHKQQVLDRIQKALADAQEGKPAVPEKPKVKIDDIAESYVEETVQNDRVLEYKQVNFNTLIKPKSIDELLKTPDKVATFIEKLLVAEQPITNLLAYKRVCAQWGITRVTPRLTDLIDSILNNYYCDQFTGVKSRTYWHDRDLAVNYTNYRTANERDILEIPVLEVMNAMLYVVGEQISLPKEDLKRLTSQVLGFQRKGTNLEATTEIAYNNLLNYQMIKEEGGNITLTQQN